MPFGLRFQRKHPRLGYRVKYLYYVLARRSLLEKCMSFGNENAENTIYVVKPDYQDGVEGLLSLIYRQLLYIDFAYKKGYIPYVDWKNYKTQYYDGINNAWEFFFEQPSVITEEEVYSSKNVYLSGWKFKNINQRELFESKIFYDKNLNKESSQLIKKYLKFNKEVLELAASEAEELGITECIGVYLRGTDYVKLRPSGEYVQPTVEQVRQQVEVFIKKYDAPIFLVTEDGEIYDTMRSWFGERIRTVSFDTYVYAYEGKNVLSKSDVLDADKKQCGIKYLVKMILLSKCKYLVSSMTQGSKFSYALNDGKYEDEYIFDLGLYK